MGGTSWGLGGMSIQMAKRRRAWLAAVRALGTGDVPSYFLLRRCAAPRAIRPIEASAIVPGSGTGAVEPSSQ